VSNDSKQVVKKNALAGKSASVSTRTESSSVLDPATQQLRVIGNFAASRGFAGTPTRQAKLSISSSGDRYEREADKIAEHVISSASRETTQTTPTITPINNAPIQRDENDKSKKTLTEGAGIVYEQLQDQPGFEEWKKKQTDSLKLKLWDSQPTELKISIIGSGLSSAGILGAAIALNPKQRASTVDLLQDVNLLMPLSLLPYSEYFPVSSFKYKLPSATYSPYTFKTEFGFDAWFKLMSKRWHTPNIKLSVGVDSAYSADKGFSPVTGGNIKLKFGGGIINVSAFYNQALPPTPMLISNPGMGEPPMWSMRSLPGQLEESLPKGTGVFLTVDVMRLPKLFSPPPEPKKTVQRKEKNNATSRDAPGNASSSPASVITGQGRALDSDTKSLMESRFGQDFSHVRIHNDQQAANSAQAINAKAYTIGNHIVFGADEYQPATREGRLLLAHELAHVIQQTGAVQRKENNPKNDWIVALKQTLEEGRYASAYLQLNDHLGWEGEATQKPWLADHPEIRFLFLKNLPATFLAGTYSAAKLMRLPASKSFAIIDCWYQEEKEKQLVYAANSELFDYLLATLSPYTGKDIVAAVKELVSTIESKKAYVGNANNAEFHTLHLLAPTVERKIKFYDKYEHLDLFSTVKKKMDPYTGLSLNTMETLTDTNEVNHKQALRMYNILKGLPEEQRRAFLDAALFAGNLESDADAQKYYKKKYRKYYQGLPHNWDFAFFPWNWGEAPFADRLTVDHAALMSRQLYYEDLVRRKFGFDRGLSETQGKSPADPDGTRITDKQRLLEQFKSDRNFNDRRRLAILLAIAVRGGIEQDVTDQVLVPKNTEKELTGDILAVIESYGFVASDGFKYHDDKVKALAHDDNLYWYSIRRTLFKWDSGSVFGEQRGTFDLRRVQGTSDYLGSLGGMRFGSMAYENDQYYNTIWLEEAVKAHAGSGTLSANLAETQGSDRRGQVFASIRNDIRQANVYAATLPVEGINFFRDGTLYRSGPGVLQGLAVHLSWNKDTSEPDNAIDLQLDIGNLFLNQFEMVAPTSTLAIGQIGVTGFRVKLKQNNLAAAKGLFIGLLKNADFMFNALISLLPNVLTLLPYAVMAMTEEFKGVKARKYKDALGEVLKRDFSALEAGVTFMSLKVRNMYDTAAGFLDDITVEKPGQDKQPIRQGLNIEFNDLWVLDTLHNLKERIRVIDEVVFEAKAAVAECDLDKQIKALEAERKSLLSLAAEKGLRNENRDAEVARLREIYRDLRKLNEELEQRFTQAKATSPLYNDATFKEFAAERRRLSDDLEYIDKTYLEDKKALGKSGDAVKRYEARRRMEQFEAKYKSVDVKMDLRGITLHGGNYVRDLINDSLKSVGFVDPKLEGIENINIAALQSSFVASGVGVAQHGNDPGLGIRGLHLPRITAPAFAFKTDSLLIEAGKPDLQNIYVAVALDFAKNPLNKDPHAPYSYVLDSLYVGKATFNGLKVKAGKADPLLDFPADVPVQVWGLHLWDYDPKLGKINLKMQDVKALGVYKDSDPAKQANTTAEFGVDTTIAGEPRINQPAALDLRYQKAENSIATQLHIPSAWLPSLDIKSPTLEIAAQPRTTTVQVTNLLADVVVYLGETPAKPTVIEIRSLHLDKIAAQGVTLRMMEAPDEQGAKPAGKRTIQEVALPKNDNVSIENIDIKGLRVTLADEGTQLNAIDQDASIHAGKGDLGGIAYKQSLAKGSVLKTIALHRGNFDAITLDAVNRKGRVYTLKEFLKFFGGTRVAGLNVDGTVKADKTTAAFDVSGKRNLPISIDYVEPKDDKPGHYQARLPLKHIKVPELHIEKEGQVIEIPRSKNRAAISMMNDVDVKLRAYIEFNEKNEVQYDVYLDSLDIGELSVYGLEYHNKEKGIDVVFDPLKPLHIPNVRAGGFRFSSWKAFDVFGKEGGWIKAAQGEDDAISAHFEKIYAALEDGSFLAEKNSVSARSALDVDIASLGFKYDKLGNITVNLGKISGGLAKLTISQKDAKTGAATVTTLQSVNNKALVAESVDVTVGADGNKVIDAKGFGAGEITLVSKETLGKETSTTTVKLGPEALGAQSAIVKLNADKSKEITITDIHAGKIDVDLIAAGVKGKSENYIKLPDPDAVKVEKLIIVIDPEGKKHITLVKPTIKNVSLRQPSQTTPGDYLKITADLAVDGNMELGDGDFDSYALLSPYNAFVGYVENDVPVEIKNLKLKYRDTSKSVSDKDGPKKELTEDQKKLLDLEKVSDEAKTELDNTPAELVDGNYFIGNPEFRVVLAKYQAAVEAYDEHKTTMIAGAKKQARESMTKKYLDAASGTIKGSLRVFDSEIPLNIETFKGENYVELSKDVTDNLKKTIRSLIDTTVDMPFWSSKEMKAIGEGLDRWWVWASPTAKADVKSIANGNAFGAVSLLLRDIRMWPGILETDKTLFGINLNIEGYWGLDAISTITGYDSIGIGLCETHYKHPEKDNFYSLYSMIEYLNYVAPSLVSASGQLETKRLEELAKGVNKTSEEVGDMGMGDAVNELVLFIKSNLAREAERLKNTFLRNIKGVNITADVSLRPQDVISTLFKEHKAGSFTFDKGKSAIENVHIEGYYANNVIPQALGMIGGGAHGTENINIPGATYLSEDKATKVSYDALEISAASIIYEQDIYRLENSIAKLRGLKCAIKKNTA
jgi:hypothetical protein